MARRVTLIDVARHAGVSRTAASYVLTGRGRVSTATRERVQASIETLGYVYNEGAAALRRKSRTIGVIVPKIDRPFFGEVLSGVESTFTDSDYMALMVATRNRLEQQARLLRMLREHQVAALVIIPATGSDQELVKAIRSWDVPTIFLSRYVPGSTEPYVGSDEVLGGYLAADHLVRAHGCRSITYLGGPTRGIARADRLKGVRRALAESGSEVNLVDLTGESTVEAGLQAGHELIGSGLPDGIICHNDSIAMGVARSLYDTGRVGATRIIGYDDIVPAKVSVPSLTSVATSGQLLGETAARSVLAVISGAEPAVRSHLAEPQLILRESCGDHS